MESKRLDVTSSNDLRRKVTDVKVVGDPDAWLLLCKASSEKQGWMKSTKAMNAPSGVVLQVTTQDRVGVAEALVYVPGASIQPDVNGGFKLV